MLDLELVDGPAQSGVDVVSLPEMKRHLRAAPANVSQDEDIVAAIEAAVDSLHGPTGRLNRTILPCTWRRYLRYFPRSRIISLPYPPLIRVVGINYDNGESPLAAVSPDDIVVRTNAGVGEIVLQSGLQWPTWSTDGGRRHRAVSIDFEAGYTVFPPKLKQLVKMLAAHYLENKEATITDRASAMVNRKVEYGADSLINSLRVPNDINAWE